MRRLRLVLVVAALSLALPVPALAQFLKIPFEAANVEPIPDQPNSYFGTNGAKATFNDVTIESDTMVMLGNEGKLIAKGDVKMSKVGMGIVADEMVIDFFSGFFEMKQAQGYFAVATAPKDLFYFSGADLYGYPDRFTIRKAYLTSCPFDCAQEWHMAGSKALVKSGKSLEMWSATGYIGSIPIFYMPYLYFDLHQRQSKWNALVGKSKTEGKFIKSSYTFLATASYIGTLMLDHSDKKGNRYGLKQQYRPGFFGRQDGSFNFNRQEDKQAKRVRQDFDLKQAFPFGGTKGNLSFTRASNYNLNGPDSNNSTANFQLPGKKLNTKFGYTRTGSGLSRNQNLNSNLTDTHKLFGLGLQSAFDYTSPKSSGKAASQTLNINETLTGKPGHLLSNWSLRYQKQLALSDSAKQGSFFSTTQSPALTASFNPKLWKKNFIGSFLLLNSSTLTMAVQGQGTQKQQKKIVFGDTEFQQRKSLRFGKTVNLELSNRFKQAIFGSGDARYQLFPTANLGWKHSKNLQSTFNFSYQQQHGRDPFFTGRYSKGLNGSYQYRAAPESNKWNFNTGTNYNFLQHKFTSPLTLALSNFRISRRWDWTLNASTGYDLEKRHFLQPLDIRQRIKTQYLDLNFTYTYDLQKQRIRNTQAIIGVFLPGGYEVHLKESHNFGSRGQGPLFQNIVFSKTNCCTGYQLSYEAKSKSIFFNWYISAFPNQKIGLTAGDSGFLFNSFPGMGILQQGIGSTGSGGGGSIYGGS